MIKEREACLAPKILSNQPMFLSTYSLPGRDKTDEASVLLEYTV